MKNINTKLAVLLVAAITMSTVLPAWAAEKEETPIGVWQKEVKFGLNILQSSYSTNWNGGEKSSAVWTGTLDARYEKQFSKTSNWRNTLKLAYGQTHNQERDAQGKLFWKKPDKTEDIIDFESIYRWTTASGWDPYASFTFKSLFQDLTDIQGRELSFNPKSFKESFGVSRTFIKKEKQTLTSRVGVAFIQHSRKYFQDDLPSTATGSKSSNSVGIDWITDYKAIVLNDRVTWESKLTVTLPTTYSGEAAFKDGFNSVEALPDDIASYTTTVDTDWENTFTTNITKMISVQLYLRWVYDKYDNSVAPVVDDDGNLVNEADVQQAIRKAGQFKQTLALGIGYTFN
jgi:hypothetical protein